MKRRSFVWWVVLVPACVANSAARNARAEPVPRDAAKWVLVQITFEPPLVLPGWLVVHHESGVREQVRAARSGVELMLPVGPASLRLEVGGRTWERPVVVEPGGTDLVWAVTLGSF